MQNVTTFSKLGLDAVLLKALDAEGYETPTPIQARAIPSVLEGRDLLGIAQTGTGKTAAFALPIVHRLLAEKRQPLRKGCRALILSPTRELATQIAESFKTYGRFAGLSVTTVFGGVGANPQIRALSRGVDVVVATPGRLLDHIGTGLCDLSGTEILVLDEADQMLDLGFVKPIRTIVAKTSRRRQTLFFSATMPREIAVLADEFLDDPVSVRVTPVATTADRIEQRVLLVDRAHKPAILAKLLENHDMVRTLVFTRTKRGADRVAKSLTQHGMKVRAIHGNKSQNQRQQALEAFKASKVQVLVATDIAARGIDISQVSHVINYDLPEVPESYVHRIGRTARAGLTGEAISLCDGSERKLLRDIERVTKQTIPSERMSAPLGPDGKILGPPPGVVVAEDDDDERRGRGRPGGRSNGARGARNGAASRSGQPAGRGQRHNGAPGGDRSDRARTTDTNRTERGERTRPSRRDRASASAGKSEHSPAHIAARAAENEPRKSRSDRPGRGDERIANGGGRANRGPRRDGPARNAEGVPSKPSRAARSEARGSEGRNANAKPRQERAGSQSRSERTGNAPRKPHRKGTRNPEGFAPRSRPQTDDARKPELV